MPRKPYPLEHVDTSTPAAAKATADELRHVADLVEGGHLHLRKGKAGKVGKDGWQPFGAERKFGSTLADE